MASKKTYEFEPRKCENCGSLICWYIQDNYLHGICYKCMTTLKPIYIGTTKRKG